MNTANDLVKAEADYRKARFTIIGHGIFFVACCTLAVIARRMFKLPPALLTVVFVVALLLFGGDLLRFLSTKRRLGRLREAQTR